MKTYRIPYVLIVSLVLILSALLAGGLAFYNAKQKDLRNTAEHELVAIAELKTAQIANWRSHQLAEARELMDSQFFIRGVANWIAHRNDEFREFILTRMRSLQMHYGYEDVILVDPDGRILLNLKKDSHALGDAALITLENARASRQALLTDLHISMNNEEPHIGAIAPLYLENDDKTDLIGAIVLQSDARHYLYPLIQSWPLPSKTGETLLVRRDGDDVLYLNELRHRSGTALDLRIPLTRTDVPAVRAVLGETGLVEGIDYRGVPVIAVIMPVPDSPWFMVAKIDRAEALTVWQTNAALIILFILGLMGTFTAGAGALWQRGAQNHYLNLARAETARHESAQQHRLLFESMSQGVLYQDGDGRITDANPAAERILGMTVDQMRGLNPLDLHWKVVDENGRDFPVEEHPLSVALRTGQPVHDVIMGVYNPIIDDTVWINFHAIPQFRSEEKTPYQVHSTLEDITERVRMERALRER